MFHKWDLTVMFTNFNFILLLIFLILECVKDFQDFFFLVGTM